MQPPLRNTLLGVVQKVSESLRTDVEVVATVVDLINSGRVRPCGAFAGTRLVVRPSLSTFLAWVRSPAAAPAYALSPEASTASVLHACLAGERQHDVP